MQAARRGTADAREAEAWTWTETGHFVSRLLYTTSYTAAYRVVFPAVLLRRFIPVNNAAVQGLIDGVHAARQKVEELHDSAPASRRPTSVHRPSRTTETKRSVSSLSPPAPCSRGRETGIARQALMSLSHTPSNPQAELAGNAVIDRREWFQITLSCIGDSVIAADRARRVMRAS